MTYAQEMTAARERTRARARRSRRRLLGNVFIVLAIAATFAGFAARRAGPQTADDVITAEAERADLVQTVSATGSVTAQTGAQVKIGAQITGRIKHLYADVGSQMRAGQVIAELDVPDLQAQVQQAEAALALSQTRLAEQLAGVDLQSTQSRTEIEKARAGLAAVQANLRQAQESAGRQTAAAEAAVRQAQANATNAATALTRQEQVYQKGYVAAADVDNARAQSEVNAAQLTTARENLSLTRTKVDTDIASAQEALHQAEATLAAAGAGTAQNVVKQAQVAEARETVRQSVAQLSLARSNLDKAYIRSPISGTVLQLAQQEGETIAAGLSAPTLIVVADLNRLQVDAFVDETDIGKVRLGQPAQVTVDAYPNRSFAGRVAKIASGSTTQNNVVTYDVTIALENPRGQLKPDMTATVNIEVARRGNVLTVPVDAVKQGVDGASVTTQLTGPHAELQYETVPVRTGISNGERTEILSGLGEGDIVVLAGKATGAQHRDDGPPRMGLFGPGSGGGRGGPGGNRGR